MARPLTGTRRATARGHYRALPTAAGAKGRTAHVFADERAADAWLAAGIADLRAGRSLLAPDPADLAGARPRPARRGTEFRAMAGDWAVEHYQELRRADPAREASVAARIEVIATWMEARDLLLETMTRDQVKALSLFLARGQGSPTDQRVPDGLDPDALVTMDEAVALPGTPSESTLKRRQRDGLLQPQQRHDGRVAYRVGDLYSSAVGAGSPGGLRRGPRRTHGYAQQVLQDFHWVFEAVCAYATDHGVAVPADRASLELPLTDRPASPKPQLVALTTCAAMAGRLHVVYQTALWLMRILGLRISEAYGLLVEDIVDEGPGRPGIVVIRAQGGRRFAVRDRSSGVVTVTDRVEDLKTRESHRVLVAPPALMDLLRTVIAVFHTAEDGTVNAHARLVPGLNRADTSGQAGFRAALRVAAVAVNLPWLDDEQGEEMLSITPHSMRRSVITELTWEKVEEVQRKRFAGHAAGDDVHHRHYVLDDPTLRPAREVAEVIQATIATELLAGLAVPTPLRCTTGHQKALAADAPRIDAELAERGWLMVPHADGEPLLAAQEVARELGCTVQTARRWMADGTVPAIVISDRPRGAERRARMVDVLAVRDRLEGRFTLVDLAEELDQTYHTVYQYVRAQNLPLQKLGERDSVVPPATAERLRAHYRAQADLHRRAVPRSVAVITLQVSLYAVDRLIADGTLEEDERTHDGRRMVTRASLAKAAARRTASGKRSSRRSPAAAGEVIPWAQVRATTGLSDAEIDALVADETLVAAQIDRGRHITRRSLLHYLVDRDPDRLQLGELQAS